MYENDFYWLLNWYQDHCNGAWESNHRITMDTLDNPGWFIKIDLDDTELAHEKFEEIKKESSEDDWLVCFIENNTFKGVGGLLNFPEILKFFRLWVEANQREQIEYQGNFNH